MKNIYDILAGFGIQLPEDKRAKFDKEVIENYKTVADYEKQTIKVGQLTGELKTATDGLKAFEGVDVNDLQGRISTLTQELATKEAAHAADLAQRDFDALLDGAITTAKGRSAKAVRAMLDVDALKASKNQETDLQAALAQLAKSDAYLFDNETTPPPYAAGTGTGAPGAGENDTLRAAMGLPVAKN